MALSSSPNMTIYALSTAPGRAAIAVIRVSGPSCREIYRNLCPDKPPPPPRVATLRTLHDPDESHREHGRTLDHGALVVFFPSPKTVTGEDVLELHVHGGRAVVRSVLGAIAFCGRMAQENGVVVRPAEPGEFTKWAFYNGRLDLTQAEALGETLSAETEQQRRLALTGADGGLARRYEEWRHMLLYARGELEALIDFSEDQHFDESPLELVTSVREQVDALKVQIGVHLQNASRGELLRSGITVALLGAPNAGKSSLLNLVVGREAAIVSPEEGTTRDVVDVSVDLDGWLCRLGDMAGLRASHGGDGVRVGLVEQEGIRRARQRALQSDVVVVLLSVERRADGSLDVSVNAELAAAVTECQAAGKSILLAVNKVDLLQDESGQDPVEEPLRQRVVAQLPTARAADISLISCRQAAGDTTASDSGGIQTFLRRLTGAFHVLAQAVVGHDADSVSSTEAQAYWTASLAVTHRQSTYLEQCLAHLDAFLDESHPAGTTQTTCAPGVVAPNPNRSHMPADFDPPRDDVDIVTLAEHLRHAAQDLAKITGRGEGNDVEDVLGVVFER